MLNTIKIVALATLSIAATTALGFIALDINAEKYAEIEKL